MKECFLIVAVLICFQFISAQESQYEYGRISNNDIQYNVCPYDTTAEAVVLYDKGDSHFDRTDNSFVIIYERTTRIKILKQAGVKWAEIEIPFYQANNIYEKVYNLEATAYNFENGRLLSTKLNKTNIHDAKMNSNWLLKKFAIPDVKAGTIIEYKYAIESEYIFNLRDWEFQWKIPVLYSQYKVSLIPFYQYSFLLQGASKFDEHTSVVSTGVEQQFRNVKYKDMVHTYVMKNIPAFKDEEFIASQNDYIIKLDFQLSRVLNLNGTWKDIITTWPLLIKDLLEDEDFGKYISKSAKSAAKIFNLEGFSGLTQQEKFDSVINHVKRNYSWNKYNRKYASKSVKDFMNDKFGNSAEVNLFAIGLLQGVGIKAYPVLVSTRDNGKIRYDYPFLDFFNYVVIKADIDSTIVLSDATDILIANNRLPLDCINDRGLIIQKNKTEWVNLQHRTSSKSKSNLFVQLNDTLSTVHVLLAASEYDGIFMRKKYGTDMKLISEYFAENNYNVADSTVAIKNMEKYSSPYSLKFVAEFRPEKINNKLYLAPFFSEAPTVNPLKQQTRTYPIDMAYARHRIFTTSTPIPEGYEVEFLPEKKKISNQQFEMDYYNTIVGNNINTILTYSFKQAVYDASEYARIKAYYSEIISKANEKIVFVKK